MPTDSNGLYSLPAGYLAVTGETILASQHNPPLEDIEAGLTARLMRSGVAPMTGVLRITDGAVGAPSLALSTATTWGLYKTATGLGLAVAAANVADFTPTALVLPAALTVAGNATISKTTTFKRGADVASAGALTLGDGNIFNITGTTSITSIGTKGIGTLVWLRFAGILTLTYHATNLILPTSASITTAAGDWGVFEEYGSGTWRMVNYLRSSGSALVASLPRGYIDGGTLSNGTDATNDINVAPGSFRDSTNAIDITIATAMGKQLDANWAAGGTTGTPAGLRNSAAGIANATYHLYAVAPASGVGDVYGYAGVAGTDPDSSASISTMLAALQAESGGSSYLYARRLGSIMREGATIVPFVQVGDDFTRTTPLLATSTAPTTTAALVSLGVPLGPKMEAWLNAYMDVTGGATVKLYISSPDQADLAPSGTAAPGSSMVTDANNKTTDTNAGTFRIRTDTSGRVRWRSSATPNAAIMVALGWRDNRGRNA